MSSQYGSVRHGQDKYSDDRNIHTSTIRGFLELQARDAGRLSAPPEEVPAPLLAEFDFRYSNPSALGCEDQERDDAAFEEKVRRVATAPKAQEELEDES